MSENNEPKRRLSSKKPPASAQTEIEFSVPSSLIKEPNHKTLNETLEFHSIINSYNSNEPTSSDALDQTQPSPTRQALKEIQLHQDAVDTGIQSGEVIDDYSIYEDYDSMWQDDVKADNDFGYSAHADTSANIPANVKFTINLVSYTYLVLKRPKNFSLNMLPTTQTIFSLNQAT